MMNISDLIRDTIVGLCRANGPYSGRVEIDGIICISGPKEGQQLVIKVHECLEAFVKESVETWMNKTPICEEEDDRIWTPSIQSETLNLSRLRSAVSDRDHEGLGTSFEARCSEEQKNLVQTAKDSNFDDSVVMNLEKGERRFNEGKDGLLPSLECKLCPKSFTDQESIEVHNELCHNLFTCQSCLKTFTSRSNLERHSRLHTGHKPYICTICDKAFSRKDHLSNHMTKHAFKCGTCSKKFGDHRSLASHFTYDHSMTLVHVCQLCNEGFGSSTAYEDHLKCHPECQYYSHDQISSTVVNGQVFSCHSCPFATPDALTFYRHRLSHMFSNKSQYSCVLCNKPFENLKSFMEHSMEHQNSMASQTLHINWLQHFSNHYQSLLMTGSSEAYQNSSIGQLSDVYQREFSVKARNHSMKDFSEIENSEKRAKRKHEHSSISDLGGFKTDFGDQSSPGLAQYKTKRTAFSSRQFSEPHNSLLDGCNSGEDNVFEASPINLKMERPAEIEDNSSGPQQCGVCQRWFNTFDLLDNHCLEEHNRSACMFCSKTFAQRANRDRHLCLHTGKKPYNCSDCNEKFSRGDKLKMHRIKVHGAIYPSRVKEPEVSLWTGGNTYGNLDFRHSNVSLSPSQDCFETNTTTTATTSTTAATTSPYLSDQPPHDLVVEESMEHEVATRNRSLDVVI